MPTDASLAATAHTSDWANFFNSTPPIEQLRATRNLTDQVNAAMERRAALAAETDAKSQQIYFNAQRFKREQELEPLKMQALQARIDATGATERRKALESQTESEHTAGLNNGMMELYRSGVRRGTPEFQSAAVELLSKYPHAHLDHVSELGKLAGFSDELTPEQYISESIRFKKLATDQGLTNPTIRTFSGKPVVIEGQSVTSPEDNIKNAVAREKALIDVRQSSKPARDDTDKRLTHLESLRMKSNVDNDVKAYLDKEITALKSPTQQVAPERTATNPQTGDKVVFRNGAWQPLTP